MAAAIHKEHISLLHITHLPIQIYEVSSNRNKVNFGTFYNLILKSSLNRKMLINFLERNKYIMRKKSLFANNTILYHEK